jgi:ribosomal protein S12 methylthiotransferase
MNRSPASLHIKNIVRYAREKNPLFALRTTVMVGFPGETDEQFEKLVDFLEEAKIDRVGAFVYSPEAGTKAALMPQVPDAVKEARRGRLMEAQARFSRERNALFVGKTLKVLIEEAGDGCGKSSAWGRSYRDAPEVDGTVCVERGEDWKKKEGKNILVSGSFVDVKITDSAEYDLFGEAVPT